MTRVGDAAVAFGAAGQGGRVADRRPVALPTRRTLLRLAGGLAAAGLAARAARAEDAEPLSPVTLALSSYMSEARDRPLPAEVQERAKHHILDTFAAIVSGSTLPPGRAALGFARSYGGAPVATIATTALRCGAIEAALVNGTLAHSDETDDSLARIDPDDNGRWRSVGWHPGCGVVPAAFAAAEQFATSGARFIRAVALGYDVGGRMLDLLRPEPAFRNRSTHQMCGTFGAGAAAAGAAGLDPRQMRYLLEYCAQQAAGMRDWYRDQDHIMKGFVFGGAPARNGVTAALLVKGGWTAVEDFLAGDGNFLLANGIAGKGEILAEELGKRFEITRTSIKKWTAGFPAQPFLEALETLLKRRPVDPKRVREIVLRLKPGSVVDDRGMPSISVQHLVALMLVDGTVTFASAHDDARMKDPRVNALAARVRLDPAHPVTITLTLDDGTQLSEQIGFMPGTPANPMTREQVVAKSHALIAPVLGEARSRALVAALLDLENRRDMRTLRPLLQRGSAAPAPG
ncbi:MmgE/PrpD family protein [Sphingomonas sp.]|uniref:MmgE/PrpD family protein n=1 Tax=Sphingomonas sp. TaxID=28214 RepID=UPI001B1C655E|nr:MmgE/PrpD family protein [Sphingomonas sp.]MBO9713316.1 MmgE/PrpD family protein [Sphingomonas sp.]